MKPEQINNRVDLRAYPSQTDTFFWIIVTVILGVMVASAIGSSPILMWPTTLTMLILPVRALLAWPDREIKKQQDLQATAVSITNGTLPRLQTALTTLATTNGYSEPIKIIIISAADAIYAVGSWRRHFLFIGQDVARRLDSDLQTPKRQAVAEAILLHEIAHFLHRDVQRVGYTRELLRGSVLITLWWMIFLTGFLGFAHLAGQALLDFDLSQVPGIDPMLVEIVAPLITLSPSQRAEIVEKMATIQIGLVLNYVIEAFTPIIWMSLFLWLFFWRRMLRLQEHYADYFVNSVTQQPEALHNAWLDYDPHSLFVASTREKLPTKLKETWRGALFHITDSLSFTKSDRYKKLTDHADNFKQWFAYHPTFDQRCNFLENPIIIYGSWGSITLTTVALVLALEVLQVTPLIDYRVSSTYVIHFATLASFVLLATWALPLLAQQKPLKSPLRKSLILIQGIRGGWILLNLTFVILLSIVAPNFALEALNLIVISRSHYVGSLSSLPIDGNPLAFILSIIPSFLGLQILSLGGILLLLFIYIRLQRQAIQAGKLINWRRQHWQLVFALSLAVVTLMLTPLSDILQGGADALLHPARLVSYAVGIGCVLWLIGHSRRMAS